MRKLIIDSDTLADWLTKFPGVREDISEPQGVIPPSPDQVALAIMQGMFANPKSGETVEAVMHAAWVAVPQFYVARQVYVSMYATLAGIGPISEDV